MSAERKQGVATWVPVRLTKLSNGDSLTGIPYTSVIVYVSKAGDAPIYKALSSADWIKIDDSLMPGLYWLKLSASDTDTIGFLLWTVACTDAALFSGLVNVVGNLEAETFARIGAPVGATISVDVADVRSHQGTVDLTGIARTTDVTTARDAVIAALPVAPDNASIVAAKVAAEVARDTALDCAGLLYRNGVMSGQVYDGNGNLTSADLKVYDSPTAMVAQDVTHILRVFRIEATYDGQGRNTAFSTRIVS